MHYIFLSKNYITASPCGGIRLRNTIRIELDLKSTLSVRTIFTTLKCRLMSFVTFEREAIFGTRLDSLSTDGVHKVHLPGKKASN